MASPSSQPKSVSKSLHDETVRLLCDGAVIATPTAKILKASRELGALGLITARNRKFVRCADPKDLDFTRSNRACTGRIYLDDLDEAGHEYRCPECDRPVFPSHGKQRYVELQSEVRFEQVIQYLRDQMPFSWQTMEVTAGVYRIDMHAMTSHLCIVDCCADGRYLDRDWARNQPTAYVCINKQVMAERFLEESWVVRVALADVVCGIKDLRTAIEGVAAQGPPAALGNVSVPVYSGGRAPFISEPAQGATQGRLFIVEVAEKSVRVNDVQVVAPQAGIRLDVFRALWRQFVEDIKDGRVPNDSRTLSIRQLVQVLDDDTGYRPSDESSVRRAINRIQSDIERAVKRSIGLPIAREDIIQTVRWQGGGKADHGYRINPCTVAIRPFQG